MASKNQAGLLKIIDAVEGIEKCLSCAICLEISSNPVETRCGHLFCRTCIKKVLSQSGESCPVCKSNLTRRSVSSSDRMGLCVQQLSELHVAIREDTGVDVTSMKTHCKNTSFLPSEVQKDPRNRVAECVNSQAKQKIGCSKESPANQLAEQSYNNLSCKLITTKSKLKEISSRSVATTSPPRIRKENLMPEYTACVPKKFKLAPRNPEMQQPEPKAHDESESHVDQSLDESRPCLRDISACNQNLSLSDQSLKTWSRVSKFGRELRHRSKKTNSPRPHKKVKLCVNVRDKNSISHSVLDNSTDREKLDRVDHDANTNDSLVNRHEDNTNILDDKINETISEKANPANCNRDDETVSKSKEPMITVNAQSNDENVASEIIATSSETSDTAAKKYGTKFDEKERLASADSEKLATSVNKVKTNKLCEEKGKVAGFSSSAHSGKSENKTGKQFYDEGEKHADALVADLGKKETTRAVTDKINQVSKVESRKVIRTKRTQYAESLENIVSFKKLGHLFKEHRKRVTFLYLGATKPPTSEVQSASGSSICRQCLSSRLPQELVLIQKPQAALSNHLSRAKSFEYPLPRQRHQKLPNNPTLHPLPSTTQPGNSDTRIERDRADNFLENQSASKAQMDSSKNDNSIHSPAERRSIAPAEIAEKTLSDEMIATKNHSQSQRSSTDGRSQSGLAEIVEKTLPNEMKSPDSSITEKKRKASESPDGNRRCPKKISGERVYREVSCTESFRPITPPLPTDIDASDAHRENLDYSENDFPELNALQTANITLRHHISKDAIVSMKEKETHAKRDVPNIVQSKNRRDVFGLEDQNLLSKPHSAAGATNSESHGRNEDSEMNLSQASMMDITGQEMLLKKFEEQLFGGQMSGNKGQGSAGKEKGGEENEGGFDGFKENNPDSSAIANSVLSPEPQDRSVGVPTTDLMECNEPQENYDFMDLTPPQPNKHRDKTSEIGQSEDISTVRPDAEKQIRKEIKCAETPLSSISRENKTVKRRPLYQSTPISSTNLQYDKNLRTLKVSPPKPKPGCILCSGLTSKQSDDVRYLSSLFNIKYTKKFDSDVTHVIVKTNDENNGACKTLKFLQGVAYRKWVLNFKWIVDCLSQKKLLDEEMYEVVDSTTLIPGPKKARIGEKAPFEDFAFLCIKPLINLSVEDCEDLLRQMGATVVGSLDELAAETTIFKIILIQSESHENDVIGWHQMTKAVPVAQEWIVDCISQYRCVSLLPFLQELVPQDVLDLGFPEELIQDDGCEFVFGM